MSIRITFQNGKAEPAAFCDECGLRLCRSDQDWRAEGIVHLMANGTIKVTCKGTCDVKLCASLHRDQHKGWMEFAHFAIWLLENHGIDRTAMDREWRNADLLKEIE